MRNIWTTTFVVIALCSALPAWADYGDGHGHEVGHEDHHGGRDRNRGAPEPLTLVGLGLGAGAIGVARWRASRKKG